MKLPTTLVVFTASPGVRNRVNPVGRRSATKETLLAKSGFRLKTIATERQREQIEGLPEGQVSAITYQHKLYYVYRTTQKDQIYVGKQQQFEAYKQALSAPENTSRVQKEMQDKPDMVLKPPGRITCASRSSTDSGRWIPSQRVVSIQIRTEKRTVFGRPIGPKSDKRTKQNGRDSDL